MTRLLALLVAMLTVAVATGCCPCKPHCYPCDYTKLAAAPAPALEVAPSPVAAPAPEPAPILEPEPIIEPAPIPEPAPAPAPAPVSKTRCMPCYNTIETQDIYRNGSMFWAK
ncbi:MAG: hypothetical protein IT440_14010 [Phycisphaeraceae bacterium]|nr:hypothetical protein [Phycisphaeraceae bacterium]